MTRRSRNRFVFPIISAIVIVSILISALLFAPHASAGDGPKTVLGYVYDQNGDPIPGANVTINMRRPDNSIRSTLWYDATDSDGFYSVTFFDLGGSPWEIGDTIEVIALYGADSASNTTIATPSNDYPVQYVNVTIAIIIPEFGFFGSFSVLVMSMTVVATFMIARQKGQR